MTKGMHAALILVLVALLAITAGCSGGAGTTAPVPAAPPGGDLTNQNSPEAATYTAYPSQTKLHTPAVPVGLRFIAGGFAAPMTVSSPRDGSGRLFLADQTGVVKIFFMNGTVLPAPFLDIRDRMIALTPGYDERGLYSLAFHPQYATNGRVFVYYAAPLRAGADPAWSCTNRLSEFHVSATNPDRVDPATEKILLEIDKPYQNHNGGTLLFGPSDGYLYLPLGDGGRADDTGMGHTPGTGNAQDMTKLLGKVIRIDVDNPGPGKQYGIPADNPFVSVSGAQPEIFAYGFRNPAYATFDSAGSHRMFIAMAGQRLFESVLIIYRGGAYPWNIREGTHCFDPANDGTPKTGACPAVSASGAPLIGPVAEPGHDVGDTVVGGVLYRGSALSSLGGSYIFGTWSDDNRIAGNGTLLVATPPPGIDAATLPADASVLTPAQNAMWTTREIQVSNNKNGRINAFIRALAENDDHEVLVLINQNGGPGLSPQASGEVWMMVPAGSSGLGSTSPPAPAATETMGPGTGAPVTVRLTIRGGVFSPGTLNVPAGAPVTLIFDDQDPDPHNFGLYSSPAASMALYRSPIITGPVTETYRFTAPAVPGTYYFRSDPNVGVLGFLNVTAPSAAVTNPPADVKVVPVTLTAQNIAFSTAKISVPSGANVVMTFVNRDAGMPHNFALYTNQNAVTKIFTGDLVPGPGTATYTFTAPVEPGDYYFQCDVHPELMNGVFSVT